MRSAYAALPYQVDATGLTASEPAPDHVAHLIEQILLVDLGERVNRQHFGCALRQLIFGTRDTETKIAVEALVQGSLRRWLGHRVQILNLDATIMNDVVAISLHYVDILTQSLETIVVTKTG